MTTIMSRCFPVKLLRYAEPYQRMPIRVGSSSKDTILPRFQPKLNRNAAGRFGLRRELPVSLMMTAGSQGDAQRGVGMGINLPDQNHVVSPRLLSVDARQLRRWCAIPAEELPGHRELRVRYRQVPNSIELGALMAEELIQIIEENNRHQRHNARHYPVRTNLLVRSISVLGECTWRFTEDLACVSHGRVS